MVKQWLSVEKKVMVPFLSHKVLSMWHCSQKQSGCAAVMFGNVLKSVFVFWYSIEKVKCGYIKSLCVYSQKGKPDGILKTVIWEYGKNSCSPLSLIGWLVGWLVSYCSPSWLWTHSGHLPLPPHTVSHMWAPVSLSDTVSDHGAGSPGTTALDFCLSFPADLTHLRFLLETLHQIPLSETCLTLVCGRRYLFSSWFQGLNLESSSKILSHFLVYSSNFMLFSCITVK